MLKIKKETFVQIENHFQREDTEQGALLGSRQNLEQIDVCCQLPVKQSSKYFIVPDAEQADRLIKDWAAKKICFCGMIHSHVCLKEDLSEADVLFAEQLYRGYSLPFLWFGIGVVKNSGVKFKFYRVEWKNEKILIKLENYAVV